MKIPRTIHQTWKVENIPEHLQPFVKGWKHLHPEWEYKLWTDEMNRTYIAEHFPGFLNTYDNYPAAIQRVDAVRYFILLKEGGLFIDLDFECLKPVDSLLSSATFVIGREPGEHAVRHGKEYILSNAFMASVPSHGFLQKLCSDIQSNEYLKYRKEAGFNAVLDCAGPFMLSRTYEAYSNKDEMDVIGHEYLYPLIKDYKTGNVDITKLDRVNREMPFAVHHYWGSWWKK